MKKEMIDLLIEDKEYDRLAKAMEQDREVELYVLAKVFGFISDSEIESRKERDEVERNFLRNYPFYQTIFDHVARGKLEDQIFQEATVQLTKQDEQVYQERSEKENLSIALDRVHLLKKEVEETGIYLLYDSMPIPMVVEQGEILEEDSKEDYIRLLEALQNPMAETMRDLIEEADCDLIYHSNLLLEQEIVRQEPLSYQQISVVLKKGNQIQRATLDLAKKEFQEERILEFAEEKRSLAGPYLEPIRKMK